MRSGSTQEHWQTVYSARKPQEVGWYQSEHKVSLMLIMESGIGPEGRILDAGSGSTTLLDGLLDSGFEDLIAVDLSDLALQNSRNRLGDAVEWVVDDLTRPSRLLELDPVDLWHDRAVLHFFTSEEETKGYLNTMMRVLKVGGHAVIETFATTGAEKCSGLVLQRYDAEMLSEFLGDSFQLLRAVEHIHTTPGGGERPYVSTLFRRIE